MKPFRVLVGGLALGLFGVTYWTLFVDWVTHELKGGW